MSRNNQPTATDGRNHLHAVENPSAKHAPSTEEKLRAALGDNPGATTAELAMAAGVGRSTAGKVLARWDRDGVAIRSAGRGPRKPDTWTLADADTDARVDARVSTDAPDGPAGGDESVPVRRARLPKGGLRGLVEDHLADHATESFGPAGIGKDLGRSGGAVNNALEKLVADGYAIKTCEAPKRFAINPANDRTGG